MYWEALKKYKVMIVDDNMSNLIMAKKALEDIYEVLPVSSGISALECLNDMPELPDLVLLDVDMPNVNGFRIISEMKNNPKLIKIPTIFLTAQDDDATELESYNLGAMDYIKKPYTTNLLRKRIDVQLQLVEQNNRLEEFNKKLSINVQEQVKRNVELQYSVVEMFVDMMEKREPSMGKHARRIEKMMEVFISAMIRSGKYGISGDEGITICFAAKIHDLGQLCLADEYLNPLSGLSGAEGGGMRNHTHLGADTISKVSQLASGYNSFMTYTFNMCRYHHERWDGNGYPDRLKAEQIPVEARALAIVDTYDNLRVKGIDGKELNHQEACMKIKFMKFTAFDPLLVDLFLTLGNEIQKNYHK